MVDEYLDDAERAEQVKRWFKENWLWLAAGIGIGLGGLYGWQGWNAHLDGRSQAAEQRMTEMLAAFDANDRERGRALAAELNGEYGSTVYADQARLVLARVHVEAGELAEAAKELEAVMRESGDAELALVARTRLARVQSAQGEHEAALATLAGAEVSPAVSPRIDEIRGDVLLAKGDRDAALAAWRAALEGGVASPGLVDAELLQLKIEQLEAGSATPPAGS